MTMKYFVSILGCSFICMSTLWAQASFEGKIIYQVAYEGGQIELLDSLLPEQYVFYYRNNQIKLKTQGGLSNALEMISIPDSQAVYLLNHQNQTFYKLPEKDSIAQVPPQISKSEDTEKILGYICQKYRLQTFLKNGKGELIRDLWMSTDLNLDLPPPPYPEFKDLSELGLEGYPLKLITTRRQLGSETKMILTAQEVSEEKLAPEEFIIPENYTLNEQDLSFIFEK